MLKKILKMPLTQTAFLTVLVLTAMLWPFGPLEYLENQIYDFCAKHLRSSGNQSIAIVAIDEKSVAQIGDWPWPRSYIADMVNVLSNEGTRALGLCLLYEHPELRPGLDEIKQLKERLADQKFKGGKQTSRLLSKWMHESEVRLNHDAQLIAAVRRARNTVLPLKFVTRGNSPSDQSQPSGLMIINSIKASGIDAGGAQTVMDVVTNGRAGYATVSATGVRTTFAELAGKAGALGHVNITVDPDGKIRRLPLLIRYKERLFPALALQLAAKYLGVKLNRMSLGEDIFGQPLLQFDGRRISADSAYRMLIRYDQPWTRSNTYSFVDLMNGTRDPAALTNKIVLIGVTDEVLSQRFHLDDVNQVAPVEIMANTLANLLSPVHLSRPSWARVLEIVVLFYFAVFLFFVIPRVNLKIGAVILSIFLVTWCGVAIGLLTTYGYWIKLFGPVFLACAGFLTIQSTRFSEKREREKVEIYKNLGLSYQGQGMLDMAHENYMQCPVGDSSVKNLLYNLGLDFERKRMFNRALAIYEHIRTDGTFKDIKKRIGRLKVMEGPLALSVGKSMGEKTMVMDDTNTHPTFGRYEILRELGRGAMGTVYLGRDPKINREVAIKTLEYGQVAGDELADVKSRFFREAEAAGKLSHPNIVAIFDAGEEHDMAYIAMELLIGKDLTHYCKPESLLPQSRAIDIIVEVTSALDYAHQQGVIHRDIKPANIMMLEDGRIKVTDFGIARVVDASQTKTGVILGTPSYMSPEQVAGKDVDGRSDLFTLGAVFYQLLAGAKPFGGDSLTAILYAITHKRPTPLSEIVPDIAPCIERIVNRLLTKGVTKRYQSATQVLKEIKACRNTF
ncbi:MAG: serine/threonine-protein kinase [Desulfobacteraceae bacterium]|jgi:serine/threonine-protein kinase